MKLNKELLAEEQLDDNRIQQHQKRILEALKQHTQTTITIQDACTRDNGGISTKEDIFALAKTFSIPLPSGDDWNRNQLVTCIPAAGAAGRYFSDLHQRILKGENVDEDDLRIFQKYGHLPKALIPATTEGDSFLDLKKEEQTKLFPCLGNVLIVASGLTEKFKKKINDPDWFILEQGKDLSTIRFQMDGNPFIDEDGKYSVVSAGHGELVHLFDKIANHFPQSQCLHIRNIDNIIGTQQEPKDRLNELSHCFQILKNFLDFLREQINKQGHSQIPFTPEFIQKSFGSLFHWPHFDETLSVSEKWAKIQSLCNRPLSVFGVVKKEKNDVGGGPVFAKTLSSKSGKIKLCMEMPHASAEQREEYFGSQGKVTYFNPVLNFFEIRTKNQIKFDFDKLFDDQFWLLSQREYRGTQVCYHETILYELIGNSKSTNLVFIETPRSLFKPHKSLIDSKGHNREYYRFL